MIWEYIAYSYIPTLYYVYSTYPLNTLALTYMIYKHTYICSLFPLFLSFAGGAGPSMILLWKSSHTPPQWLSWNPAVAWGEGQLPLNNPSQRSIRWAVDPFPTAAAVTEFHLFFLSSQSFEECNPFYVSFVWGCHDMMEQIWEGEKKYSVTLKACVFYEHVS